MNGRLNVLSLFSGIGGLELGLERAGMNVVGQVEIDEFCRRVLAEHWPHVPRHDDVRTAAEWWLSSERPTVDVICGGFPCQDISAAGRRAGVIEGGRSSLWGALAECIRVIRPRYAVVENVPRVLVRAKDGVIPVEVVAADLAAIGYDLYWDCLPAAAFGAPHLRDRWFGVAYLVGDGLRLEPVGQPGGSGTAVVADDGSAWDVADADSAGFEDVQRSSALAERPRFGATHHSGWWRTEPDVGRVVHGVSSRLDRRGRRDRVHALGNAVVPQVAEHVGRLIVAHHESLAGVA